MSAVRFRPFSDSSNFPRFSKNPNVNLSYSTNYRLYNRQINKSSNFSKFSEKPNGLLLNFSKIPGNPNGFGVKLPNSFRRQPSRARASGTVCQWQRLTHACQRRPRVGLSSGLHWPMEAGPDLRQWRLTLQKNGPTPSRVGPIINCTRRASMPNGASAELHTEILALRQQVAVLKRKRPRPSLRMANRVSGSSCLAYGLAGATPW